MKTKKLRAFLVIASAIGILFTNTHVAGAVNNVGPASTVHIYAAGSPAGGEYPTLQLLVNDSVVRTYANVQGNYVNRQFIDLSYERYWTPIRIDEIKIRYVNDAFVNGQDRNAYVDRVNLDGTDYQTEGADVYSTGSWSADNGCGPGKKQTETLACNGDLTYASPVPEVPGSPLGYNQGKSLLQIYASGSPAGGVYPTMQVSIKDQPVATFTNVTGTPNDLINTQAYTTYVDSATKVGDIKVAFTNDAYINGEDRNLFVEKITYQGFDYDSADKTTYSSGVWDSATGCAPGNKGSRLLSCGGYFLYGGALPVPTGPSTLKIYAAGTPLNAIFPQIRVMNKSVIAKTFENITGDYQARVFNEYTYTSADKINIGDIRILYDNDDMNTVADRNVKVDKVVLDGITYETEAPTTYTEGSWDPVNGCAGGYKKSEILSCNGRIWYKRI